MLVYRFAIISIIYLFWVRIVFTVWNWDFFKSQQLGELAWAFIHGLRFDWMTVCMVSILFYVFSFLWPTHRKWGRFTLLAVPFAFVLLAMILSLGDSEYVHLNGRRLTKDALFIFNEVPGKFFQIVWAYAGLFLASCGVLFLYTRKVLALLTQKNNFHSGFFKKILVFVFFALGVRGGWQLKPLGFPAAQIFSNPMMNNLVLNSGFTVLKTWQKQSLPRDQFFSERSEMLQLLPGGHNHVSTNTNSDNVVLIILESFNLEYMEDYTPFLKELSQQGLLFTNAFANARRSIEGVAAILAGIPALMSEPFINSQYMTNYYLGIGTVLAQKNYHTSFFHGAKNGTMYFDSFTKSAGIQNYFGLNEYPDKSQFDGTWGIWDEPFLSWTADQLNQFKQPFFTTIFTLSSHNPFHIPKQYQGKFAKGTLDIHPSIAYTDYALRKFFEKISTMPWYKNTLFVLVADHTYKSVKVKYQNNLGDYRIPLIFFHPGLKFSDVDLSAPVSQIDILPSILDYLGIDSKAQNYLSSSVFRNNPKRFVVLLADQKYVLIDKKNVIEQNIFDSNQDLRIKAVRQYFSEGMWDNKLYYPGR